MRKRENTAEGCRELALGDQSRAADAGSEHMRKALERSADAWTTRAQLLERLDARFNARAKCVAGEQDRQQGERTSDGQGTEAIGQGGPQAEGQRTQEG